MDYNVQCTIKAVNLDMKLAPKVNSKGKIKIQLLSNVNENDIHWVCLPQHKLKHNKYKDITHGSHSHHVRWEKEKTLEGWDLQEYQDMTVV